MRVGLDFRRSLTRWQRSGYGSRGSRAQRRSNSHTRTVVSPQALALLPLTARATGDKRSAWSCREFNRPAFRMCVSPPGANILTHEQLGNYLGALKNWVDLQNSAHPQDELYFFIAGLHALTVPQNPKQLLADKQNLMATLMAIGLDPNRCTIFHQDEVEGHTELGWMLSCVAPFGKLERMTTWKVRWTETTLPADQGSQSWRRCKEMRVRTRSRRRACNWASLSTRSFRPRILSLIHI